MASKTAVRPDRAAQAGRPLPGLQLDVSIVSYFSDIARLSGTLGSLADSFRYLQGVAAGYHAGCKHCG